jgi:hypothetical protein
MRAAALLDPYWLQGRSAEPDEAVLRAVAKAAGPGLRIDRMYWYLECDGVPDALRPLPRVTVRATARDDLDDGFELVRAMDADLRQLADSGAFDALVVASLDDRLALTLEWVKARGITLVGCRPATDEPDPRMLRLFDDVVEPRFERGPRPEDAEPLSEQTEEVIRAAVTQWQQETDPEMAERTRQFVHARPGLPRLVDSRLLFLTSRQLGRELSEAERIQLRKQFRDSFV